MQKKSLNGKTRLSFSCEPSNFPLVWHQFNVFIFWVCIIHNFILMALVENFTRSTPLTNPRTYVTHVTYESSQFSRLFERIWRYLLNLTARGRRRESFAFKIHWKLRYFFNQTIYQDGLIGFLSTIKGSLRHRLALLVVKFKIHSLLLLFVSKRLEKDYNFKFILSSNNCWGVSRTLLQATRFAASYFGKKLHVRCFTVFWMRLC